MHSAPKIIRPTTSTGTPVRGAVFIRARVDNHNYDGRAWAWATAVGVLTGGLQLIADATSGTAVGRAIGHRALEEDLVHGARIVTLAYAKRSASITLPVCCSFVTVAAAAGCAHVGIVLIECKLRVWQQEVMTMDN